MARYVADLKDTADTTNILGSVRSATGTLGRRNKVYDLVFGSEATPADNPFLWNVVRMTATGGTATSVTPNPLDPADVAALTIYQENYTANPGGLGTPLLSVPLNQRATFRWVAAPGGEIVTPATDEVGVGIQLPTSSAVVATATVMVEEQ